MAISKEAFVEEFVDLAAQAGVNRNCRIDFPRYMSERHRRDGRSYAEVDPYHYKFSFAIEVLRLPRAHRRGLIMHELGHCLCPEGSEDDADRAAAEAFGERIAYDRRWPGKGLQCVAPHKTNPSTQADEVLAEAGTIDSELVDWFPLGGSMLGAKLAGFSIDRGAAGIYHLYAARPRRGHRMSFYWEGNGALFSSDFLRSVVGSPFDLSAVKKVIGAARKNPPYSGYDPSYYQKPLPPDPTQIAYEKKRDALNVFADWNRRLIDDYGGMSTKHSPESFEAINHKFDIKGRRRVDTIAKALWWVLPPGSPYYLEDIDVELLNRTAPALYNPDGLVFTIPDYAEERRLLEQEAEYWERYRDVDYPEEEDDLADVPF